MAAVEPEFELQLSKQERLVLLRLRITGHDDHPIVRRGQFDIDHLHGGEFFEHGPRRQAWRQCLQPLLQRDQQTIGQKRNENMSFNSGFELVIDGTDRQITLQLLERLLDLDQLQIEPPQMARIIALDIGAQQIAAFAPPGLPQFLPIQREVECFGCDRLILRWRVDDQRRIGFARLFLGRAEFEQ